MNSVSVVLLACLVSLLTTAGVLVAERQLDPFGARAIRVAQVPEVVGLSEADARTNLDAYGLKVMISGREVSDQVAAGHVIAQSQPAGQRVPSGEVIGLKIAAPLPDVPLVIGRTVDEATTLLEAAGYSVDVGQGIPSETVEAGHIIRQRPEAGKPSTSRRVTIQPSTGKQPVVTPKVGWTHLNAAKQAIEDAGLKVGALQWVDRAETPSYLVLRQTPEAGTEVKAGTEVTLVVNAGD